MTRRIPAREKVPKELASHLFFLEECITYGFDRYMHDYLPGVQADHTPTVQAGCIHSHIIARARVVFAKVKGARLETVNGLELLTLDFVRYVIRFKKLDHRGYCSSIETGQSANFDAQEQLDGMPPKGIHLRVGYVADKSNRNIETLLIACPAGKQVAWIASFGRSAAAAAIPEQIPLDGGPKSRIVPRHSAHGNVVQLKKRKNGF